MSEIVVDAKIRKDIRKKAKNIRKEGYIPGIFYGHGEENIPIQTTLNNLRPVVFTQDTHIINLKLDNGENKTCIIRNLQFDPITDKIIHFDLLALRANEKVTMEIPIALKGTAKGVKEGGMVQHILHRLEVKCFPRDIPEHIDVDITNLAIGDSIHVSSLSIPNVEILADEESTIVSVLAPTVMKEPPAEPVESEEEIAEPEVVGKGKKEEDQKEE